ncbi:SAF domain-containing protein, partial [Nocardioides sp.]|uniref:SAF domain-containing protein n=1 Tax=Nocardioides sp. TaxID=35761 RepID=UPI0027331E91
LLRRRLLAAVLTAAAVATGLQLSAPPAPETVRVLAAASDLPAGAVLTGDDLVDVDLPAEALPSGAVRPDDALGRQLASPLRRGEPVTDVRLVAPSLLEGYPGLVAVPVRIPDAGAVGLLRVGDTVDVVAADPSGAQAARPVASRVPVLALPNAEGAAGATAGAGVALGGGLVVLGLPPESGRQVAAEAVRSVLSIVLTH